MPDLTILHTNDFHGKLSDKAAERAASEKSSAERCLLLDAGDAISSGNVYYRPGGEPILARMSDLGYDAMALGNREFHFLEAGLRSKLKLARFPILSANFQSGKGDVRQLVLPTAEWDLKGLRVVVFGLSVPVITRRMVSSRISPFWFEDPIETAARIVPELRAQADVLIALTHIGLQRDLELANSVRGIDLIVGGHTHTVLSEPRIVGDTAIVHAGWWGRHVGKVEISPAAVRGGRPDVRCTLISLG